MKLRNFTKEQLKEIEEDLIMFTYNQDYCLQANCILLREIRKELEARTDIIEFRVSRLLYFGFFLGIGIFACLFILNFVFSAYLFTMVK
jgi:hypothetical protein